MSKKEKIKKKPEDNCKGCKYWERCAGAVFGHLGALTPPDVVSGGKENLWCHNYRDIEGIKEK